MTTNELGSDARPARRRWPWLLVAGVAVAALGFTLASGLGVDDQANASGPATRLRDDPAPPLTGPTLTGEPFDLAELRGKVVVVNIMASWCAPCRDELPLLARMAQQQFSAGLRVVAVAVRDRDEPLRQLLADTGATELPVIDDRTGRVAVGWGAAGVPETFVVDRDGRVRLHAAGPVTADWLSRHVYPMVGD